jgi:putative transposase
MWNDCLRARKEAHPAGLPYVPSADLSESHITEAKPRERSRLFTLRNHVTVYVAKVGDLKVAWSRALPPHRPR